MAAQTIARLPVLEGSGYAADPHTRGPTASVSGTTICTDEPPYNLKEYRELAPTRRNSTIANIGQIAMTNMKKNILGVDIGGTKCAVIYGQKEGDTG